MRVLIDTCVLYPPLLRNLVLGLAARGLFTPLWSEAIAGEWLHLAGQRGETGVADSLARMRARWPEGCAAPGQPELLDMPDPGDRHVLAAAIVGGANQILTANLADFPPRLLAPHGLCAVAPDDFIMALWLAGRAPVEQEVAALWPGLAGRDLRRALKKAGLPRLGKALEH